MAVHDLEPLLDEFGHALELQPDGVVGHALDPRLDEVADHALEPQPGEGDLDQGHQSDEDLVVEVWLGEGDLILERPKEEAGLAHHRRGRTNLEHHRGEADPTQVQKLKNLEFLQDGAGPSLHHDPKQNLTCL